MQSFKINLALILTIVFWASAFVAIRVGLTSYTPGALALLRFIVASGCMAVIYFLLPNRKQIKLIDRFLLILLGVLGIGVFNLGLNYGEVSVTAGIASFVIGLVPILIIVFSIIFLRERPSILVYLGVAVSFAGLVIMALGEDVHASRFYGLMLIFLAAMMKALYTVLQKFFLERYHPVQTTAWVVWGGTLMLMMFTPELWQDIKVAKADATLAVLYLGIFPGAVAYVAWSSVLNVLPAYSAAMYLYIVPIASTLMGYILLGEEPSALSLSGGLLALAGALYATRCRSHSLIKVSPHGIESR